MTPVSYSHAATTAMGVSASVDVSIGENDDLLLATRLVGARRTATPLAVYPGTVPATLADAYRVQDHAIALHRHPVAGWKVGRIMAPNVERFGADRLAGPIFARQIFAADGHDPLPMPVFTGGFGAVEAEFVFRLHAADPSRTEYSLADAAAHVERVHVGIEIASSPLAQINALGPAVTVSDFGNNNGLIVGPEIADWQDAGIDDWPIEVLIDGASVGTGKAAGFIDGTLGAVRFLLELLARRGIAVPAGTLVSSGAITGVHTIAAGQHASARFGDRFELCCSITNAEPDPD